MGLFWGVSLRFAVWCCFGFGEEEEEEEERLILRSCDLCCFLFRLGGEAFWCFLRHLSCILLYGVGVAWIWFLSRVVPVVNSAAIVQYPSYGACQEVTKHQNTGRSLPLAGGCLNGGSSLLNPLRRRKQHCPKCHARKQRDPVGDADFVRMYFWYRMYKSIQR